MKRALAALGAAAVAALAVTLVTSAAASTSSVKAGASWTVWAGPSGFVKHIDAPRYAEASQFFPSTLTIHAGDSVTFRTMEGHTVTFLGNRKASDFQFVGKAPKGATYDGINDSTGNPFWFDGKAKFVYTVGPILAPAGNTVITPGTFHSRAISGPGPGSPPGMKSSVTYTFPTPGVYHFVCLMHLPAMRGTIIVKPAGAPGVSVGKPQADAAAQLQNDLKLVKQLDAYTPPKNTIVSGRSRGGIDLMKFYPQRLVVKAGTTVRILAGSAVEVHSVVLTTKDAWTKKYLHSSDQFPFGQVGPEEIYGTDPAGTPYTGKNHGNGFFATHLLGLGPVPAGFPWSGKSTSITFTVPGTYHYFCQVHGPEMSGTVVVTP